MSLFWQNEIDGDGTITFLNQFEVNILGPNDDEDDGWSYIKTQMSADGSITFDWEFTTSDGVEYDWGFYYVSANEPIGNNDIDFNANIITDTDNDSGNQTINFTAGDWVSIGVFSDDSCCGPGLLKVSFDNPPRSANTETVICVICSGETSTVTPPHAVYTDAQGIAVTQMNTVVLGGPDGLNS